MRADPSIFGHIPGIPVGKTWGSRLECSADGVHPGMLAGIYGSQSDGARSVVLSGGYEDDEDNGDTFTYTGCGGRDLIADNGKRRRTGPQAYDQDFEGTRFNMALKISSMTHNPVRVVRGFKLDSIFAPPEGYRYDGLYRVVRAWREKGKAGFLVCRFEFKRLPGQPPIPRLSYHLNLNRIKKSKRAKARAKENERKEKAAIIKREEPVASSSRVTLQDPPPLPFIHPIPPKRIVKSEADTSETSLSRPTAPLDRPVQSSRSNARIPTSILSNGHRLPLASPHLREDAKPPSLSLPRSPPLPRFSSASSSRTETKPALSTKGPQALTQPRASSSSLTAPIGRGSSPMEGIRATPDPPAWKVHNFSFRKKTGQAYAVKDEEE